MVRDKPIGFKLILLTILLSAALCGRILSGDLSVDYGNAGTMTKLSFSFMLENAIDQNDYIKVALPFPLHSKLVPSYPATEKLSLPLGLVLTYSLMDNAANVQPNIYFGQILTQTIDSSSYFIRFYASDRKTIIPVPSNQWYFITFEIQQTEPLQYQKSNSILQIQMSTVSSVLSNAMVYDDNLAFNYFSLASTPPQAITLAASPYNFGNAGGYLLTQKTYSINMDVTLNISSYHFTENLVLKFLISKKKTFRWNGTCLSVNKTNAPRINELDPSLYSCSIDSVQNVINLILKPEALALQTSFRFTADIINPSLVVKDTDIQVRAVKENSGVIVAYGIAKSALNTNQIYVTYQQIFVGWGLRPDALLPFEARIFRGNTATPSYMPYNSLSLKFSISQSTSSGVQLKVVIDIPSQSQAFVLESGYTTNLPAAPNKVVKCVTQYINNGANRRIGCTGVGALSYGTVYEIGWKMFFPYNNYEASIDCTQFGTLTIYTTQYISVEDNTFFLGRGNEFLTYLKNSSNFYVLGRSPDYIAYMRTFSNLNLVVSSQDFLQFLKQPENIYITNRPFTYPDKQYNDLYVIRQNLAFMTYISLFDDIYIAAKLKDNTDIVKGYDDIPLVAKSTPKNTLTLTTSNSKDWDDQNTASVPLVYSYLNTGSPGTVTYNTGVGVLGLKVANQQSLIFQFKANYNQVTSFASTASTTITNNWAMLIMMNPKIKFNSGTCNFMQETSNTLSEVSALTVNTDSDYNKYTLITLRAYQSQNIQNTFNTNGDTKKIAFHPFDISGYSSIYADYDNFDIMIATVDGFDGPTNKIKYNGFFLINTFTMPDATLGTVNYGFMNYQNDAPNSKLPMDGSLVPTILRIKGTIADSTNFDSLSIFFDKLTPFYSNYYTGDIFCRSTEGTPFCKFNRGYQKSPNRLNYQTLSRIDIPMTNPTGAFNIFIPVTFGSTDGNKYLYIGYQKINPVTKRKYLAYIEPMRTSSIIAGAAGTGTFGPDVSSTYVGKTVTNLGLKANLVGTAPARNGLASPPNDIGAAFSYFSEWDYIKSSTISGWTSFGTCYKMNYLFYYTNYDLYLTGTTFAFKYKRMSGVVCTIDNTVTGLNTAQLTISTGYLPSKWGKDIPGYGAYSTSTGNLMYLAKNAAPVTLDLTITDPVILPPAGPSLERSVGEFVIPLPASLDGNTQISILGTPGTTNIPFLSIGMGTCSIFKRTQRLPISCSHTASPTLLLYTLIINQEGLLPAGESLRIVHYGLSTNSTYNNVSVDITVNSLLNNPTPAATDLIFKKTGVTFAWQGTNYIGASSVNVKSFKQWTSNRATYEEFEFTFTLLSKGLYDTNRMRFDLGQFAVDNNASTLNPSCKVFDYNIANGSPSFSHDWSAVDYSQGLAKLQIWPERHLISNNLTYLLRCQNFLSTSSPNPTSIKALVVNTSIDLPGQLGSSAANSINLPALAAASTAGQITLTKSYTVPSTVMEMFFRIVSPGITSDSILYLNFPAYYSNGLGPDIKCYSTVEIFCAVTNRKMMVRYLGEYAAGTTFTLIVTGVSRSINYNSGTFSYIVDNDDDPTTILTSGTFIDAAVSNAGAVQNFPTFQVLTLKQSSNYLREQDVTITADFYLPTTLTTIGVGQSLMMVFPPIYFDVLRFATPTCTLNIKGNTLKNYISSCSISGMRLKMVFLDYIVTGSSYSLTVSGLINPTNPSSNVQKYSFEISNSGDTSIIAKTYSPNCNYKMSLFIANPVRKSLNYYTGSKGLITSLVTMKNVQSEDVYISPSSDYVNSKYERNAYLEPFNNLYTNPSNIQLASGSNPFPIRFSSLTSGVNYVYFSKRGDGSFYSNLPPLILTTNKNYFTAVSFVQTSFNLPINSVGTNYTISVTLPKALYPMSEVNMTVTLSSSVGISLRINPTIIYFYPTRVTAYINLYINDATLWTVGKTTNLVITPQGSTYASGISIPLNAVIGSTSAPTLNLAMGTINKKDSTFTATCSEQGKLIYHVSRLFSYNTTACSLDADSIRKWSAETSIDGLRVSQTYYDCQDQIMTVNVAKSVAKTITVMTLQSSLPYTIEAFCETQANVKSALTTTQFNTVSNGGIVSQISFYFSSRLTTSQKIKLVCALALFFNVDYQRVSTWDGYYCSQLLSRRRLQSSEQTPETVNLERLREYLRKNQIQVEQIAHQSQVDQITHQGPRNLQTKLYETLVFFGINNNLLNDNTRPLIVTESGLTNLKSELNANVTGLPTLYNYSLNSQSYIGSNSITNLTSFRIDAGPSYLFIEGITLSQNGLIYFIVGDPTKWSRAPLVSEIKKGSGPNGLPPIHFRILAYKTADPTSGYMAWTDMPQGNYDLYIMVSDSNPFDTASLGAINKYTFTFEVPKWETLLTSFKLTALLLIIIALMS